MRSDSGQGQAIPQPKGGGGGTMKSIEGGFEIDVDATATPGIGGGAGANGQRRRARASGVPTPPKSLRHGNFSFLSFFVLLYFCLLLLLKEHSCLLVFVGMIFMKTKFRRIVCYSGLIFLYFYSFFVFSDAFYKERKQNKTKKQNIVA